MTTEIALGIYEQLDGARRRLIHAKLMCNSVDERRAIASVISCLDAAIIETIKLEEMNADA